ncbi:MAG: hypothetical protein RIB57_07705 [Pelagibacterium sp.]|jgi:hypothetical protein|uniref:hypothetical protein n=1 Tax=Pelagibacterium sp. TaxID=1967288 RepID=UPI0032EC43DA
MSNSDRDQRLAAKLRENLRRRKAQAKARTAPANESEQEEGTGTSRTLPTGKKDT